jgi:hypothetical protein
MIRRAVAVAALVAATIALSGCSTVAEQKYRVYDYQCCSAADVNAIYAPGDVIQLHWSAHLVTTLQQREPTGPTITAQLDARHSTVTAVTSPSKSGAESRDPIARAASLHPSVIRPQKLSSDITIPLDAKPGFYNVEFRTVWPGGFSAGGATIIQVK